MKDSENIITENGTLNCNGLFLQDLGNGSCLKGVYSVDNPQSINRVFNF